MNINVTAATGELGRRVIRELLAQGVAEQDLIASVRDPGRAIAFAERGVTVRQADYNRPDTLRTAFQDTEVLLLISSPAPVEPRVTEHANVLAAARAAGVRRVAFVSFAAAQPDSRFVVAPFLLYAEAKLRQSGLAWTILRDGMYADSLPEAAGGAATSGRLALPVAGGRIAYVARDDLARALAAVCLSDGHDGKVYELTGAQALSMEQVADALSTATGTTIAYSRISEEDFAAACRAGQLPAVLIELLITMYRAVDNREFELVTDHIERLTGSGPQPIAGYLRAQLRRAS